MEFLCFLDGISLLWWRTDRRISLWPFYQGFKEVERESGSCWCSNQVYVKHTAFRRWCRDCYLTFTHTISLSYNSEPAFSVQLSCARCFGWNLPFKSHPSKEASRWPLGNCTAIVQWRILPSLSSLSEVPDWETHVLNHSNVMLSRFHALECSWGYKSWLWPQKAKQSIRHCLCFVYIYVYIYIFFFEKQVAAVIFSIA